MITITMTKTTTNKIDTSKTILRNRIRIVNAHPCEFQQTENVYLNNTSRRLCIKGNAIAQAISRNMSR